ncbi:hypothetical protein GNI_178630 [Gregarina niphandrodes]|uniref:Uncharacterized protein n=1 Tax=Gregarina niphandrodes TaxID=110365 RepID=A0A023AX34_GRENI|nr:hypothetical protein GNI_178630 [Gregarina niphandrodes]EZG43274.1 hypothetical protein GNI_178630 [Gregarina niphandrodes]|eukprot:XP_011133468.1 hypothetical protein GNI_178630 [Gregarina niphandrodes]
MKTIVSVEVGSGNSSWGGVLLGALVNPNGTTSSVHGCLARMAKVGCKGGPTIDMLVLAPEEKFLKNTRFCLLDDANRIKVCSPTTEAGTATTFGESAESLMESGEAGHGGTPEMGSFTAVLAAVIKGYLEEKKAGPELTDEICLEIFGKRLGDLFVAKMPGKKRSPEMLSSRPLTSEDVDELWEAVPEEWRPVLVDSVHPLTRVDVEQEATADAAVVSSLAPQPHKCCTWKAWTAGAVVGAATATALGIGLWRTWDMWHPKANTRVEYGHVGLPIRGVTPAQLETLKLDSNACGLVVKDDRLQNAKWTREQGWATLEPCIGGFGTITCSGEVAGKYTDPVCYEFGTPHPFDFLQVWSTVERSDPALCRALCLGPQEQAAREARSIVARFGPPATVGSIPPSKTIPGSDVAEQAKDLLNQHPSVAGCHGTCSAGCYDSELQNIRSCDPCAFATLSCTFKESNVVAVAGTDITLPDLFQGISNLQLPNSTVQSCTYDCRQ